MTADTTINLPIISTRGTALALEQIARTKAVLAALHGVDPASLTTTIRSSESAAPSEAAPLAPAEADAG